MANKHNEYIPDRIMELVENRLSEWGDVQTPLDAGLVLESDNENSQYVPTLDEKYRGYGIWWQRMDKQEDIDEFRKLACPTCPLPTRTDVTPLVASVDFVSLMITARISLGLAMVYQPLESAQASALCCLHVYDAFMRLTSATDRLRDLLLSSTLRVSQDQIHKIIRNTDYQDAFYMEKPTWCFTDLTKKKKEQWRSNCKQPEELRLLTLLEKWSEKYQMNEPCRFGCVYERIRKQVFDNSKIKELRKDRNTRTHKLASVPSHVIKKRAEKGELLKLGRDVSPYLLLNSDKAEMDAMAREVDRVRDSYKIILEFGGSVFELVSYIE